MTGLLADVLRARTRYVRPMNEQSPIVSEFATPEEAAAYEQWLREKVARSLADPRPSVPHDEAMARARAIIDKAAGKEC
jgi:hypothetical protein